MASVVAGILLAYGLPWLLERVPVESIAGDDEVRTVAIAAAALLPMLVWEFTSGAFAWGTPVWMRLALVAITGPAMVFGAFARAAAAAATLEEHT